MDFNSILKEEQNLDPQNWEESRAQAHRMLDEAFDLMQNVHKHPVWQKVPDSTKELAKKNIPKEGQALSEIYDEFSKHIFPYVKGNIHPRFWAYVQGTGTPTAVVADMLASAMNSNVTIGEHSAMYIDEQVINWCKEMMGFAPEASGMLVSGGSMANITGLIVGRNFKTNSTIRQKGMKAHNKQMTIYCSTETHSCVLKGGEIIGIGSDFIRKIEVNKDFSMNIEKLKETLALDIENGYEPMCIIANVGTVNTGAIDDIDAINAICKAHDIWFHIDGAFGALAKLTPEYKDKLKAIEQSDSIAFDLHKWMYMPYEVGCVLIRNKDVHRSTFGLNPSYLMAHEKGLAAGPDPLNNYAIELSRGFKALKVWMCIKEHGYAKFRGLIRQNIAQAFYLESLIRDSKELEMIVPVTMNVVCYRFYDSILDEEQLNNLNKEILMELQERAIASPSSTILNGKYCIRCAIVNHRSTKADFEDLVKQSIGIGKEILKDQ